MRLDFIISVNAAEEYKVQIFDEKSDLSSCLVRIFNLRTEVQINLAEIRLLKVNFETLYLNNFFRSVYCQIIVFKYFII